MPTPPAAPLTSFGTLAAVDLEPRTAGVHVPARARRELAGRLRGEICKDDLLARYGGEEFAAVLTETDKTSAAELADRLRQALLELGRFEQQLRDRSGDSGVEGAG